MSRGTADAQLLRDPEFIFQPGVLTIKALSSRGDFGSSSGLNLRFVTIIDTPTPRASVLLGTSFTPFGLSNGLNVNNDPTFFYGATFPVLYPEQTYDWLSFRVAAFGLYRYDATLQEKRLYGSEFVVQGAAQVHFGRKMMSDMGDFWSRFTLYLLMDQTLTPQPDTQTGRRDRFEPTFQYGVSIPIAGKGEAK